MHMELLILDCVDVRGEGIDISASELEHKYGESPRIFFNEFVYSNKRQHLIVQRIGTFFHLMQNPHACNIIENMKAS